MSTTQPQIVPALPSRAENSTPAEAPREISLSRPSPADREIYGGAPSVAGSTDKDRDNCASDRSGSIPKPAEDGAIPSPAPNVPDTIPDADLKTTREIVSRMRQLAARMCALSGRMVSMGVTRDEVDRELARP